MRDSPTRSGPAGLAPPYLHHLHFLAYGLGLASFAEPWAGAAALGIALWLVHPRLACTARRVCLGLAFLLGIGAAWRIEPGPSHDEATLETVMRERSVLNATVEAVESRPGRRLALVLGDATLTAANRIVPLSAKLVWNWDEPTFRPLPGQALVLAGRVKPIRSFANPHGSDLERWWAERGVHGRISTKGERGAPKFLSGTGSVSGRLREWTRSRIEAALDLHVRNPSSRPGAGVLFGLLTGDRFYMDREDLDRFARASIVHALALSGQNVGHLVAVALGGVYVFGLVWPSIFLRLPRSKLAWPVAALLVLAWLGLDGASPSMLRAALMFLFVGIYVYSDRERSLQDGLFTAVGGMLVLWPGMLGDVRFQLSAGATAGVAGYAALRPGLLLRLGLVESRRKRFGVGRRIALFLLDCLCMSIFATLPIVPVLASTFGELSPHIYWNMLWLPLLGAVVAPLGVVAVFLSLIPGLTGLAGLVATPALWIVAGLDLMVRMQDAAGLLQPLVTPRPGPLAALGWWTLCLAALLWATRSGRFGRPGKAATLAGIGLILLVGPFVAARIGAQDRLALTVLDVGQGQAVLLELPGGRRLLADGGGFPGGLRGGFDVGRAVLEPTLARNRLPRLDWAIASHPHADHLYGLISLFGRFRVGEFLHNGRPAAPADQTALDRVLDRSGTLSRSLRRGEVLDFGGGLTLEALAPAPEDADLPENEASLVLRLVKDGRGLALLPGDTGVASLSRLTARGGELAASVLVLPHHGSKSGLLPELYDRVRPDLALASAGYGNPWGFPAAAVREALAARGIPLLVTSEVGAIVVEYSSDGATWTVGASRRSSVHKQSP